MGEHASVAKRAQAGWHREFSLARFAPHVGKLARAKRNATLRSARDGRLEVCIADGGPAYNPCDAHPDELLDRVWARKRGGMGLSIMRGVMDEIRYDRTLGHRNELKLIKYFDRKP